MSETIISNQINHQYIYLLHPREHIRLSEPVYKIGRTTREFSKRMKEYPKDSKIILFIDVIDCVQMETKLLQIFKNMFKQRTEFGREYFEGDKNLMIKTIVNEVENFVLTDTNVLEMKDDKTKINEIKKIKN